MQTFLAIIIMSLIDCLVNVYVFNYMHISFFCLEGSVFSNALGIQIKCK